jgi:hypothetical protein
MSEKDAAWLDLKHAQPRAAESFSGGPPEVVTAIPNIDHRYGDGRAEILGIAVYDANGRPAQLLEPGEKAIIRISARAKEQIGRPNVGFMMRNHLGVDFAGTNTLREGIELPSLRPGEAVTVDFEVDLPALYPAHFSFSPAIADGGLLNYKMCDWIDNAITLQMGHVEGGPVYGYMYLPCKVHVNARLPKPEAERMETSLA